MKHLKTLQAIFEARAEREPRGRALSWYGPNGEHSWRSFGAVYRTASSTAARLHELGLRAGDVCVIVLPSNESSSTVLMATFLLGALPLLIAPPTLQRFNSDLAAILFRTIRRSGARLVVYGEALEESEADWRSLERGCRFVPVDDVLGDPAGGRFPKPSRKATDLAALQLTSGTTRTPRIGSWTQSAVLAALDAMGKAMALRDDDVCFNWTPLYHDMGLVNNFLLCMTCGVPAVMMKPQDFVRRPSLWLRGVDETRATVTWSPNFGFALACERIAASEIEGVSLRRVRSFWNAAERIHLDTILAFEKRFEPYGLRKNAVRTNFGCVENVGGATFSDPNGRFLVEHVDRRTMQDKGIALAAEAGDRLPIVGVGRPSPGLRCHVVGRGGRELSDGHVGELAFDTPSRMAGYVGDAAATKRAIGGPYLRTGDLGYMRNGEVFWVGRVRERITLRGRKLDPSDFEYALNRVDGLRAGCFAAFGVDDVRMGSQRLVVVAEVREPVERRAADIRADILERVYRELDVGVSEVVLVRSATLAKTSSGKRRHRRFREMFLSGELERFRIR